MRCGEEKRGGVGKWEEGKCMGMGMSILDYEGTNMKSTHRLLGESQS